MKNITRIKLSKITLQFSVIKSIEKAFGCFNILSQHFYEVDMMLKKIHEDIDSSERCINWLKEALKGDKIYIIDKTEYIVNPKDIIIYQNRYFLNITSELYKGLLKIYDNLPTDV